LEQHYRDARIHPIHEGTTGIQGLDLLGRKVMMKNGRAFELYGEEVRKTIAEAAGEERLRPYGEALKKAQMLLEEVTAHLKGVAAKRDPEFFLADATLYLELFGIAAIAWQWLKQGIVVLKGVDGATSEKEKNFYQGKLFALRFFYAYEVPKMKGLAERLMNGDGLTVEMKEAFFTD
jgi:butyryl-CoA dehydrogenase